LPGGGVPVETVDQRAAAVGGAAVKVRCQRPNQSGDRRGRLRVVLAGRVAHHGHIGKIAQQLLDREHIQAEAVPRHVGVAELAPG